MMSAEPRREFKTEAKGCRSRLTGLFQSETRPQEKVNLDALDLFAHCMGHSLSATLDEPQQNKTQQNHQTI